MQAAFGTCLSVFVWDLISEFRTEARLCLFAVLQSLVEPSIRIAAAVDLRVQISVRQIAFNRRFEFTSPRNRLYAP
jgi:hypothetical protein